jgi:hypothetical protein
MQLKDAHFQRKISAIHQMQPACEIVRSIELILEALIETGSLISANHARRRGRQGRNVGATVPAF